MKRCSAMAAITNIEVVAQFSEFTILCPAYKIDGHV